MENTAKNVVKTLLKVLIWALFGFLYFYFTLPAINFRSEEFYTFVLLLCVAWLVLCAIFDKFNIKNMFERKMDTPNLFKAYRIKKDFVKENLKFVLPVFIVVAIVLVSLVGALISSVFFNASSYSELLPMTDGDFAEDVEEISYNQIPMLDEVSANTLAVRKLGELSDIVSQFEADSSSTQINDNGTPVRITYLNYGDFFKWFNNFKKGIPAYLLTDMVTQEVTVVRLEKGIRYSPSEYFFRDIDRYLRFKYPTKMFSDVDFEIDNDGNPYWIASVTTRTIGLFGGEDVIGAVIVDAITGESKYYDVEKMPDWVDRIYTSELIIQQYDYYGNYHNGFFNYLFSQTGCTETTDGYNYIAIGTDIYLYTGITSVVGDESNIGFILVNQRTKEAKYYPCAGAEEYSAMDSAQGAVQQYSYKATFPILLNIAGEPTYFMSLKDDSNLVKMYAMVNVRQYQIVSTATTVKQCEDNYYALLAENGIINDQAAPPVDENVLDHTGVITEIRSSVMSGTTYYYFKVEGKDQFFKVSAAQNEIAVILNSGDKIKITWNKSDEKSDIITVFKLERVS